MTDPTTLADSSTATVPDPETFSPKEHYEWRKTGKFPEPKTADPAPAKEANQDQSQDQSQVTAEGENKDASPAKPAPESAPEPQKETRRRGTPAEERVRELLSDRKFDRERIADLERQLAHRTTAPNSASPTEPQAQPASIPPKPKWEDLDDKGQRKYATYDDFLEARDEWNARKIRAEVKDEQQRDAQLAEFKRSVDEGRQRYKDFDSIVAPTAQTIMSDQQIPAAVKDFLGKSAYCVDIAYTLGTDHKALADFLQTARANPYAAFRKIMVLEQVIAQELGKSKPASSEAAPSPKKITAAPAPAREVGGKGTGPADAVEAAVKDGDMEAYSREQNARDLARRRK